MDQISSLISSTAAQTIAGSRSNQVEQTLGSDLSSATDQELMDACKEFETYFVEQVLKEMEKMIPEDEDSDSSMSRLTDYFKDEMIQELAKTTAEQSGGTLAQQLYEQMKRNYRL